MLKFWVFKKNYFFFEKHFTKYMSNFHNRYKLKKWENIVMPINILWATGFEQFTNIKQELSERLSEKDEVHITEKFHKKGFLTEIKSGMQYDLVVLYEKIETESVTYSELEEIVDASFKGTFVFCLSDEHNGDSYSNSILNLGIYNCSYISDFTTKKILSLYSNPRKRFETKLYLGLNKDISSTSKAVSEEIITKICFNLNNEPLEKRLSLYQKIKSQFDEDCNIYILSFIDQETLKSISGDNLVDTYLRVCADKAGRKDTDKTKKLLSSMNLLSQSSKYDDDGNVEVKIVKEIQVVSVEKEKEILVGFNRKIINIWGNSEFGCEFAYHIAKETNKNVLLLDLDVQNPSTSVYLDVSSYSNYSTVDRSGIDILIELMSNDEVITGDIFKRVAVNRPELANLFIITGEPKLNNDLLYPSKDTINSLKSIIQMAYKNFDVVISLCNESLTDPFNISLMEISDFTIAARQQDLDDLSFFYNQLKYLANNKNINLSSIKYLPYSYNSKTSVATDLVKSKELFDLKKNYLGPITYNEKRILSKNSKKLYARDMSKDNKAEYKQLLSNFDITTSQKKNLIKYIKSLFAQDGGKYNE